MGIAFAKDPPADLTATKASKRGFHNGSPLRFSVTAVISRSGWLQLAPNSQQIGRCAFR